MSDSTEIYAGLNEIFADIFMRDDLVLRPDMIAGDIEGWDSFKQIEILMAAEERFAVKFHSADMDDLPALGALADVIARKLNAG